MHIFQPSSAPTHRLKSDHTIVGILRNLPAGVGSNRPAVNPEDYELIPISGDEAKEATFRTALAAGHTVTEGWTFALGDQDRINWDQYAAHHERKLARNQVALTDLAPMIDITGTPRVVTVERMLEIIVEIGDAYQALFFARHQPTP